MQFNYYPDTDSLYINLSNRPSANSQEASQNIVLDFDEDGNLVGIDIDHASQVVDLNRLETQSLPIGFIASA
ncbi:DUF2283 domain-containing protein [Euhalothece natronophila Z-M001]|uniref:DUF2283 domain-containing protein n=1 Tax=Euhalothece natronophila Z-M001 TaxID=522448 RepID=A0A5B8NR89_9CHRO|nr:DUF2283 domain-containing protein [Euhalothece natronophila]QDZ40735.1 DUF2283 domain-containing protein [Euhalothece natronophila Z-M001]